MTSARKREANRHNARASTGPKTVAGKTRAAQNARRHGLTVPVDPTSSGDVAILARMIAGRNASPEIQEIARRAAEAQIAVIRGRQATVGLFNHYLDDPGFRPAKDHHKRLRIAKKLLKQPNAGTLTDRDLIELYPADLEGPEKFVAVMSDITEQLTRLDRYERRALSRRKFAVRELDTARRLQRGCRD